MNMNPECTTKCQGRKEAIVKKTRVGKRSMRAKGGKKNGFHLDSTKEVERERSNCIFFLG